MEAECRGMNWVGLGRGAAAELLWAEPQRTARAGGYCVNCARAANTKKKEEESGREVPKQPTQK
jgi:hypothetical protein